MIVREIQSADLPAVADLLGQLGYELDAQEVLRRFERVRKAPDHGVRVAVVDRKIVGLLHVFERPALEKPCEAVVQSLVVDAGRRGNGVGAALMQAAETWARDRGLASVVLHTRIDRDAARAFYERIGYRHSATSHLMRRDL